jgi:hypothetical protein
VKYSKGTNLKNGKGIFQTVKTRLVNGSIFLVSKKKLQKGEIVAGSSFF